MLSARVQYDKALGRLGALCLLILGPLLPWIPPSFLPILRGILIAFNNTNLYLYRESSFDFTDCGVECVPCRADQLV